MILYADHEFRTLERRKLSQIDHSFTPRIAYAIFDMASTSQNSSNSSAPANAPANASNAGLAPFQLQYAQKYQQMQRQQQLEQQAQAAKKPAGPVISRDGQPTQYGDFSYSQTAEKPKPPQPQHKAKPMSQTRALMTTAGLLEVSRSLSFAPVDSHLPIQF